MIEDRTISAEVRYINPEWKTVDEVPEIGSRETRRANTSRRSVTIGDARFAEAEDSSTEMFGLDTSGSTLLSVTLPDEVRVPSGTKPGAKRAPRPYVEAMLELVRTETGAQATHFFADLVRTEDQSDFNTGYSRFVHCDYNATNLASMSVNLLGRRGVAPSGVAPSDTERSDTERSDTERSGETYAWYNTWQPFDYTVEQNPLAMLDVRSLADDDIVDYRYTGYDGGGGLVAAPVYNPDHRWWYYPNMTPDEVLLSKQLDARNGVAHQCPHTSFIDESRPGDTLPRRSVELRILAVFDLRNPRPS
ncbi:MAG: CmcJ/NvfI family oxidoreductase [Acidimicrobiales bacterium]